MFFFFLLGTIIRHSNELQFYRERICFGGFSDVYIKVKQKKNIVIWMHYWIWRPFQQQLSIEWTKLKDPSDLYNCLVNILITSSVKSFENEKKKNKSN